jgi:Icc-related predicted phosphoesterase
MGPYYQKLLTQYNRVVKKKLAHELKQDEYYVCGHIHCAEVDPISRFINTGMIKHGLGQYAIIKNDVFYYKQEKYL